METDAQYAVGAEEFVRAWQESETMEEVIARLAPMPMAIIHARASSYREMGIRLKKLKRKRREAIDVDALNRLIDDINRLRHEEAPELSGRRDEEEAALPPPSPEKIRTTMHDLVVRLHKQNRTTK